MKLAVRMALLLVSVGVVQSALAQAPPPGDPYPPQPPPMIYGQPPMMAIQPPPPQVPPALVAQWKGARVLNGFGGVIGLLSTGLSLSGSIYVGAAHYPPSASSTSSPKPSDTAQLLSMVSSGSAVFGFALGAGGLAWRHHILDRLGQDPGRGLFIGGTVVGAVGVVAIITSYIFGLSNIGSPRERSIIGLATSLGGSAIVNSGTAMYAKDGANMMKIWRRLTTF